MVSGTVEAFLDAGGARALSSAALAFVERVRLPLIRLQETFDQALIETFSAITNTAAEEGWERERYLQAIDAAAKQAGADHFPSSWAGTWYASAVLAASYNLGVIEKFGRAPTARLFPYLAVTTQRDGRVRRTHKHMDRFVASSVWAGWGRAAPPYGWNCRCRLFPVSYVVAQASGFSGTFGGPFSEGKWATWPGPDPGFPKWGGF